MGAFTRWMHGREYIRLLLNWRWLVLFIAIPISLVIELLEGQGEELHLLDEVVLDGMILPITTWVVLTFAARKMAGQFDREAALERRQQFTQRLAEHHEYYDLAHFLVRFPASLLPVQHVALEIYEQERGLSPATEWGAAGAADGEGAQHLLVLVHNNAQVGLMRLGFAADRPPSPEQLAALFSYAPDMAAALSRAIEAHHQSEEAYREARAYERRRITQELHDSLAQQVFYLHLGLDQLVDDASATRSEATRKKIASMRDVAADVYEQIRHNLSILRAWEQVSLTEAVSDLARVSAHNADMSVTIDVRGEPGWLSPHSCEQLYGVVREALNNIIKHARAKHVQLELDWSPERLTIRLADDGVGFEPQALAPEGHYGLALMRESLDALQGELEIESAPGGGTTIRVGVPLRLPDARLRPGQAWSQREPAAQDSLAA